MIVTNVHISLWVHRVYDKNISTDFHPLSSDLALQFAAKRANNSGESNLQSTRVLELDQIESYSGVTESFSGNVSLPISLDLDANFSSNDSGIAVVPTALDDLAQTSASSDAVVMTVQRANRRKIPPTDYILPRK